MTGGEPIDRTAVAGAAVPGEGTRVLKSARIIQGPIATINERRRDHASLLSIHLIWKRNVQ